MPAIEPQDLADRGNRDPCPRGRVTTEREIDRISDATLPIGHQRPDMHLRESDSVSSEVEQERKPHREPRRKQKPRQKQKPRLESPPESESQPDSKYRPIFTIDWRSEICRLLQTPPDISNNDLFEAIDVASKTLKEVELLRSKAKMRQGPPRFQVIHSVRCMESRAENKMYLDQPWVVETGRFNAHLKGSQPINNFELYLERNKEVVFIVYRDYECCGKPPKSPYGTQIEKEMEIESSSLWEREQVAVLLPDLKSGLAELARAALQGIPHPDFEKDREIPHPFIWWFHRRQQIEKAINTLHPAILPYVHLFRGYVLDRTDEIHKTMASRFMIDIFTHKQMHPDTYAKPERPLPILEEVGVEEMSQDNPKLGDGFLMCLPTSIPGFNMDKKEWVNLDVHYIEDVIWNTEAFDFLVIDEQTKELVQAVVTNQLHANENADLIKGKGNGLFILLHGGPGTGKTLTAESCGDIGTKAEEVEEYLQVVMHLGKTWGCGILILTSNRVGIFDEAFKSRIQLNLRYNNLDRAQRLQIWNNFLLRLRRLEKERLASGGNDTRELDYGIKADEIKEKVEELADVDLNGRQIRNAISTARQLARYRKEPLAYRHFEVVINEAKKFDEYLLELHKWYSSDEIQRDKRER
ncbi:hypothetical protein G7Z17_g1665 [Cylindrodendrum hubeiense]|uniref:AAA+ ATPase lid domain-containing protein n=1 Tax=Cylindrodendrum hubeiense TaxID=595255 RepID=A0A9P5HI62_9HYPO|nr:hypothetical protein G7Z17_g1665 [Cylindrodendrum hubeiense]